MKEDKKVTVVPELEIESPLGIEIVKTFDKAWHRLLEVPKPARTRFKGWVRT